MGEDNVFRLFPGDSFCDPDPSPVLAFDLFGSAGCGSSGPLRPHAPSARHRALANTNTPARRNRIVFVRSSNLLSKPDGPLFPPVNWSHRQALADLRHTAAF